MYFPTTLLGLDEEGRADLLPGPATRRTSRPASDEDVGPGALQGTEEEGQERAKKTRGGLRRRGALDTKSEDSNAHSSSEEAEEEEEDESPAKGRKKRTASSSLEADSPKRGRTSIPEASTMATDSSPEWDPRVQPLVTS